MPAGPIGACWASGSWTDTCWAENTWSGAVSPVIVLYPFAVRVRTGLSDDVEVLTQHDGDGDVMTHLSQSVGMVAQLDGDVEILTALGRDVTTRTGLTATVDVETET